jgi:hypothetical protein
LAIGWMPIIVGYVLWTLVLFIMSNVSGTLQREAQTGTLEQLFISPYSASQVFLARAVADLLLQAGANCCHFGDHHGVNWALARLSAESLATTADRCYWEPMDCRLRSAP